MRTYYIYGSGLIPVPNTRINEIAELKAEFHAGELKRAMMAAYVMKRA
jgi:hypothetical protein